MNLLYLDDYKREEEKSLTALGVGCGRVEYKQSGQIPTELRQRSETFEVRSNRMSPSDYRKLYLAAQGSGVQLATSPGAFEIGSDFSMQYPLFEELSPAAVIVSADAEVSQILQDLKHHDLRTPVFVRSDIESAAKYVGVEGCVINEIEKDAVENVIGNLRKHVGDFTKIIIKEMAKIKVDEKSGKQLEYRAIGMNGKLQFFDYSAGDGSGLPDPYDLGLDGFASLALEKLSIGGADGSLFLDVALTDSAPIVVECKNFYNGSVKQLKAFADSIQTI